jgi:ammonium transporter Rh
MRKLTASLLALLSLFFLSGSLQAQGVSSETIATLTDVQKYYRALHIMVMLLAGFGFLMVFVRKYGRSALTATFLLVSIAIPLYYYFGDSGIFGDKGSQIDTLILAEFAAASLLITAGAVLGRLKMHQYLIMGILFIPFYMFNEWIMLDSGFGLIEKGLFVDTGGSIVIHAFGALFGLGVAMSMTTKNEYDTAIEADATSDRFALLGSMMLWIFWPSFCAALVIPEEVVLTAVNVILALSGATLATAFMSQRLRGKFDAADIANASLAGGVAIGSVCNTASPTEAIIIGVAAGAISTFGFAMIQSRLQKGLKIVDTCGVSNLHGIPGIFGGLVALIVVSGINYTAQLTGIVLTIIIAIIAGLISGKILQMFGHRKVPYTDSEEFEVAD